MAVEEGQNAVLHKIEAAGKAGRKARISMSPAEQLCCRIWDGGEVWKNAGGAYSCDNPSVLENLKLLALGARCPRKSERGCESQLAGA